MKRFEVGSEYEMKSPCNQDCTWKYTVIARTLQTITITDGKETKKCRINKEATFYCKAETIYPLGKYSMCPSLSADKIA